MSKCHVTISSCELSGSSPRLQRISSMLSVMACSNFLVSARLAGQTTMRLVTVTAPTKPIKAEVMRSRRQDKKETVADLGDFLDKCMSLDPRQRMSLEQCSAHSFLRRT